ncbi:MAG: glycosyltransferase, partial [Burkholderiaceae bacterium]|nr:glycosyltransferase [Burkholderiaceae bacterium]
KVLDVGSPTKLVEYMALGRPVVCNNHPEQSAILAECPAGLCVEWSAAAFAEAMLELLQNPEEAEAMGARGPAWVASNRTYPILATQVWNRYQSILEEAA